MDYNENIDDQVNRYLNGEIEGDELSEFEKRLNSDDSLLEQLEMNKALKFMLEDSTENELRRNLEKLNREVQINTASSTGKTEEKTLNSNKSDQVNSFSVIDWLSNLFFPSNYRLAFVIVPMLLLLGWWIWNSNRNLNQSPIIVDGNEVEQISPNDNPDLKEQETDNNADPKEQDHIVDETGKKEQKEKDGLKENVTPSENSKPQSTPKELYAGNFDPIPSLEFLIDNNLRDNSTRLQIDKKTRNVTLSKMDDVVNFQLAGYFDSEENMLSKDLMLHLFSNDKNAFEEYVPIYSNQLNLNKETSTNFSFESQKYILLKPGLYYYILEDTAIEKYYLVEKFEVRLR